MARISQVDQDIEAIFDALIDGGFTGTSDELAAHAGVEYNRLWVAMNRIRSPLFIADNGWTVPYVPKGQAEKLWSIADTRDDSVAVQDGVRVRAPEVLEYLRRVEAQISHGVAIGDGRSAEVRWLRMVKTNIAAMVSSGEMVFGGP